MKINLIGHASLLVETKDCKILMDPLLYNPAVTVGFQDICPQRQVFQDLVPKFDILVISHKHIDHFDIRSLANLPKDVDVLIPKDKFMETCLRKLGYRHIYTLKDFNEVRIGSTRLVATRSENRVPEFGMVFADPDGVLWNQVDSIITSQTISKVKSRYPEIDFLLAAWQPLLQLEYQHNKSTSFPYSTYSNILKLISLIAPKAVAPGANGFKHINGSSWLNQIVFPITQAQFCQDLRKICPNLQDKIFSLNPGDIVALDKKEATYTSQQSSFVQTLFDDRDRLHFAPTNLNSKLIDDNPEGYDLQKMESTIETEISLHLTEFIHQNQDKFFLEYFHWQVIYQLEVVFPHKSDKWYFDFSENTIKCRRGTSPLANFLSTIAASGFFGLLQGYKGWDYVNLGGYYRSYQKVYRATPYGIVRAVDNPETSVPDPLMLKFPYQKIYQQTRNYEIARWSNTNTETENQSAETPMTMVAIGNTLIKPQPKLSSSPV
jgi:UDP-MurNAc hydroxylase